jgi:hypothetical protein
MKNSIFPKSNIAFQTPFFDPGGIREVRDIINIQVYSFFLLHEKNDRHPGAPPKL